MSKSHQEIGRDLKLFFFNDYSPGSCFWLPHGTIIYNNLLDFMKRECKKRGYQEVKTPIIFNQELWKVSGHWDKYKNDMFIIEKHSHNQNKDIVNQFSLKPMNCPSHCVIFNQMHPSYKDLPIRLYDNCPLHRAELSGSLSGLTRVRLFRQDDAHIFCTLDQIDCEMENYFEFLRYVYGIFGFKFKVELSTRPEKYIGDVDKWNIAENILKKHIKKFKGWKINEGDGAFYGPKIDISLKDKLKREHQCATIQLDFNQPERFDLKYKTFDNDEPYKQPVIIHRAIFGSFERFIAILLESTQGRLPLSFSPRQICFVPILQEHVDYTKRLMSNSAFDEYEIMIDESEEDMRNKIKKAEQSKYNYIVVIGDQEINNKTLNIRKGKKIIGEKTITQFEYILNEDTV